MPRPQFSLRTLLWLTLVVAAFMAGIAYGKKLVEGKHNAQGWVQLPVHLAIRQFEASGR
jgi:hypothetical protein